MRKLTIGKTKWWESARFGLFIHYGIFSALEGEFHGVDLLGATVDYINNTSGGGVGAEWIQSNAKIPRATYRNNYKALLTSSAFNAANIALAAKNAGLKYVVITVKHHDGFVMYNTSLTDWNISLTPSATTIIADLKAACLAQGLKFGIYFSQNKDWYQTGGMGAIPELAGASYTYDQQKVYVQTQVIPMLGEIINNFNPDILWFDGVTSGIYSDLADLIYRYILTNAPNTLIVNNRLFPNTYPCDFSTPEGSFDADYTRPNEICFTMNNTWGWDKNDVSYKADYTIINLMIEAASRGGNAMINVGPKPDGSIATQQQTILTSLGTWMTSNGDAIYGTKRVHFYSNQRWGRLTQKGNNLYAIVLAPSTTSITIEGVSSANLSAVTLLSTGAGLSFTKPTADSINITGIPSQTTGLPYVVKLVFASMPYVYDYINVGSDLTLSALAFKFIGLNLKLQGQTGTINFGSFRVGGTISTRFKATVTGTYTFQILASGANATSSVFTVTVGNQTISAAVPGTGSFNAFVYATVGSISLVAGTIYDLTITKDATAINVAGIKFL